jgi:hypothetical protein
MGQASPGALITGALSLAAPGLSGAGSILKGNTDATNYQNQGFAALLKAQSAAINAQLQGQTAAANYTFQGESAQLSDTYNSQQAELAAEAGDIKAAQTATFMSQQTQGTLANIDAVLASTGSQDNSPSAWAVKNRFEATSEQNRTQTVFNIEQQSRADRNASALYLMAGARAMQIATYNANAAKSNADMAAQSAISSGVSSFYSAQNAASAAQTTGFLKAGGTLLSGLSGLNWSSIMPKLS